MRGRIRAGLLASVWVQFSRWLFNVTRPPAGSLPSRAYVLLAVITRGRRSIGLVRFTGLKAEARQDLRVLFLHCGQFAWVETQRCQDRRSDLRGLDRAGHRRG